MNKDGISLLMEFEFDLIQVVQNAGSLKANQNVDMSRKIIYEYMQRLEVENITLKEEIKKLKNST
jgi:hypothetical protein